MRLVVQSVAVFWTVRLLSGSAVTATEHWKALRARERERYSLCNDIVQYKCYVNDPGYISLTHAVCIVAQ